MYDVELRHGSTRRSDKINVKFFLNEMRQVLILLVGLSTQPQRAEDSTLQP